MVLEPKQPAKEKVLGGTVDREAPRSLPVADKEDVPTRLVPPIPKPVEPIPSRAEEAPTLVPDALEWLSVNASKYPIETILRQEITFPIIYNGRVAGSGILPVGRSVQLVSINLKKRQATLACRGYGSGTVTVPLTSTDLVENAARLMESLSKPEMNAPAVPVPATQIAPNIAAQPLPGLPAHRRNGFVHPGVGLTIEDLAAIKANLNKEPWASGYEQLKADGHSSLDYNEQGPFAFVNRNNYGDYSHGSEWKNDMQAVYNLARMWYFTGDSNYAQKAHDILLSWAVTQKHYDGIEAGFDVGDYAYRFAGGADILRGTWPGWTQTDTDTVKNYFETVLFPGMPKPAITASQGMEQLMAAVAIASFNDDEKKFNQVLDAFLNDADTGLADTLANGEVGDMGRDQGHTALYIFNMAWIAEVFWKQGVDVYQARDSRILACAEYYSRFHLPGPAPSFVPLGAPFWGVFNQISGEPRSPRISAMPFNILEGAYVVRMRRQMPWMEQYHRDLSEDEDSFMYRKAEDTSTAVATTILSEPTTDSVSTGLNGSDLNGCSPPGSTDYHGGTWTLKGGYSGKDPWEYGAGDDSVHFSWMQVSGDFTLLAKVNSVSDAGAENAKAGIMLRDSLHTASIRAWVGINPRQWVERAIMGWSGLPYGSNAAAMGCPIVRIPYWVKMVRCGERISLFTSPNGGDWSPSLVADFDHLPDTVYAGLFVCSLASGSLSTATFTNVRITGGDGREALQPPPAPFAIYASSGDGSVSLHWNEAFTASSYHVKRAPLEGGPFTTIATVASTSYTDADVRNGATWHYTVSAVNAAGESSNSAEDSATPQSVPVNVAVGGIVSASTDSNEWGHPARAAFDHNPGTKWMAPGPKAWIAYDLGTDLPPVIQSYAITSSEDVPGRDPGAWEFQGSRDGSSWTTLDKRNGQTFPFRQQTRTFALSAPADYRYYRLNITANSGDAYDIQLSELALLAGAKAADSR